MKDAPESVASDADKKVWLDPEISEPKDLIGYPDGLILQGGDGSF